MENGEVGSLIFFWETSAVSFHVSDFIFNESFSFHQGTGEGSCLKLFAVTQAKQPRESMPIRLLIFK